MKKNNKMKKILTLALSLAMTLSLCACTGAGNSTTPKPSTANPSAGSGSGSQSQSDNSAQPPVSSGLLGDAGSDTVYSIGICNYVNDASLNQIYENIQTRLDELGKEKGVAFKIDYDNPEADSAVMNQIISNFKADKVDLMVGIATPVAVAKIGRASCRERV